MFISYNQVITALMDSTLSVPYLESPLSAFSFRARKKKREGKPNIHKHKQTNKIHLCQ